MKQAAIVDGTLIATLERTVPPDWADYNGHMTEARYLHVFGEANDAIMELVGCDADYIAAGHSFFTVETHIRHLDEVDVGSDLQVTTQVLAGAGKRMHLFHRMWAGARLLATGEHMMIHVSLQTRRACAPLSFVAEKLAQAAAAHRDMPQPDGAGRGIGDRR